MAFEVTLPELFTVSSQEYEALHGVWLKAVKVLPDYTVVHKQDIFVQEQYRPDIGKDDLSFLSRSFEREKHMCSFPPPAKMKNHYLYIIYKSMANINEKQ